MKNLKENLTALQEKAKERTVKTQSIEYDLETLVKKISKGIIKLDPEYQRRHRWNNQTSSRLIESLILNIPIPIIYLSQDFDVDTETEESRYTVIDGQQRLTAINNYCNNVFPLEGLDTLDDLNECYYRDLPPFLIRRLEERTVKCMRIDSTIDAQVRIDIFERLNSGSVKLEPQELRNAVYGGRFNLLCKELSKELTFRKLLQINVDNPSSSNRVRKMEDVELVLRFFSLADSNYKNFKKSKEKGFKDFLSDTMAEYNKKPATDYKDLSKRFTQTMEIISRDFGDIAFAKFTYENDNLRLQSKFNVAVYDALSTACHDLIHNENLQDFSEKKQAYMDLFKEPEFYESISGSYLDSSKLAYRIERTKEVLR